jgi:hypothetical protein
MRAAAIFRAFQLTVTARQGDRIGRFCHLLGDFFSYILGDFVSFWAILSPVGRFCHLLGDFFTYWAILSPIGRFCLFLECFLKSRPSYGVTLGNFPKTAQKYVLLW